MTVDAVTVIGPASSPVSATDVLIGVNGNGVLTVEGGAALISNGTSSIGFNSNRSGTATVGGTAVGGTPSTWIHSGDFFVGDDGTGTLTIENGGTVNTSGSSSGQVSIGYSSGSSGMVTVDGTGSTWTNGDDLNVGFSGAGTLMITNGGTVSNADATVGNASGSTGMVTVDGTAADGTPSTWTNSGELHIGNADGSGALTITNGGAVSNTTGYVGQGTVLVDGTAADNTPSTWKNTGALYIGNLGEATLTIQSGGVVENTAGYIGSGSTGTVMVDGSGSRWINSGSLFVGHDGAGTLTIQDGGVVSNSAGTIGDSSASSGSVTVDGAGSTWTNTHNLFVGHKGTGTLTIENGGAVSNSAGTIGNESGSTGTVTVAGTAADGTSSSWTNSKELSVGYYGSGTLTIENGGAVSNTYGYIGRYSGSSGTVTVAGTAADGTSSSWTNSKELSVGYYGKGSLTIANGGSVNNTDGYVGRYSGSTGTATVDGAGSSWSNIGALSVGDSGVGTLTIANGGTVGNTDGYVGRYSGSTGTATVDGAGSSWSNNGALSVGYSGAGMLTIMNGGTVSNTDGIVGNSSDSTGTVKVTGADSSWTSSGNLYVGSSGTGALTIGDGGAVSAGGVVNVAQFAGSVGTITIGAASGETAAAPGTLNTTAVQFGAGTGKIVFNHTASNYVFAPSITGAGAVWVESGTTILTTDNTYSGGTTIAAGTLQLGDGGTSGSIVNDVTDNGIFAINRSDTYTFVGAISGSGAFQQNGSGTTILTAVHSYSGATDVNAGALIVDGSIASSSGLTVATGALVGGNGFLPTTVVNGTLSPGTSIGLITVNGDLTFAAGSTYLVEVSPTTADRTDVTGTATLGGTVQANFSSGGYVTKQYTILHADGGLGGTTFSNLDTSNVPIGFSTSLSYDASNVYLDLMATLGLSSNLSANLSDTPQNVASGINDYFNNGGALPLQFLPLFTLTGTNLSAALDQLSGEVATGAQYSAFQFGNQFLTMMLDPFVYGRTGFGGGLFGPGEALVPNAASSVLSPEIADIYDRVLKAPPAYVLPDHRFSVWASGFGSANRTQGDPTGIGSHDITTRTGGYAAGMDYRVTPDTVLGFALGGGFTNWALADGLGSGKSDVFQAGFYGVRRYGAAYVAGAANFAEYWMKTDRTAFAGDHLLASFIAKSFGGRVEGGYRWATWLAGVTPYAALQTQQFYSPGYYEADLSNGGFGLNYYGRHASDTRSELGARFDRLVPVSDIGLLALQGRAAWAHDWVTDPTLTPMFQTLPGAGFSVSGATPAPNSALASAGADLHFLNGWALSARFDGAFADSSQTYAGTGTLRYKW